MMRLFSVSICISFLAFSVSLTQTVAPDTAKTKLSAMDTTKHGGAGIDTLVNYTAKDSIVYSLRTRYMNLYGKSEMQYQTIDLKAERVNVNWDSATLLANGIPDTAKTDSIIGRPILRDGGDEYHGEKIMYNFHSRKGKVTLGTTHMENGYYIGDEIKKVETDVLYVKDGRYTTCDAKDPHFYFASPKMKVYVRDKVVAEPVYFYIADVPVLALPFGVFPAHGGRASGIITPAYGHDDTYGWYLSHLGYFWAASDYWDIASMFDFYSRGKWRNRTNLRYALRYNFSGSLTADITNTTFGQSNDPGYQGSQREYNVNFTHNQQIDPSSRVDVNFSFSSGNYFKNYSNNLSDILMQSLISTAMYSKRWEASNRSLTVNLYREQVLSTGQTSETLPQISFSQGLIYPFRKQSKSIGLSSGNESSELSFIDMLGFSYNASFSNSPAKIPIQDSAKSSPTATSLSMVQDFKKTNSQALAQSLVFSITPKIGHFTVAPSLSLSENRTWTQAGIPVRNRADSTLTDSLTSSKLVRGNLSTGVGVSTNLFGIVKPNIFGINAIRHALTPTFGLSYDKQIYGDNIPKYQLNGSFGVTNSFEMKVQKHDSVETENKIKLINIGANVSYNFVADSMNFSPVTINYNTEIGQYLNISGGATYKLYVYDPKAGQRINRLYIEENGKFGDLTSISLNLSTTFRGEKKQKPSEAGVPEKVLQEQEQASGLAGVTPGQRKTYYSIYDKEEADFSIPWNISLNYSFLQSQDAPQPYSRSSSASASLSFNLTDKWQISTSASYDFVNKPHFSVQEVDVTRDLHCWQMSFTWYPMGIQAGYRFEIKVRAPQLQDIKLTKQSSQRGYND